MEYEVILMPSAEADLVETYRYIGRNSARSAANWYRGLMAKIETLRRSPDWVNACGPGRKEVASLPWVTQFG